MPHYMAQVSYTPKAWASLIKKPQNRLTVVAKVVEAVGGKLLHGWLSFGEYDTVVIAELPDNISAAALSMAITAGGACQAVKTTPLMTTEEGVAAMKKAGTAGYRPPA